MDVTKAIKPDDRVPLKHCKTSKNTLNDTYALQQQCIKMDASLEAQLTTMINESGIKVAEFIHQTKTDNESDDDFEANPLKLLETIMRKKPSLFSSDNDCDDDCYYALVIDDIKKESQEDTCAIEEKSNNNNYGDIEFEQTHNSKEGENKSKRELRKITNELVQHNYKEHNFEVESFISSNPKAPVSVPVTILENKDVVEEVNISLSEHEEIIQSRDINDSTEVQLDGSSNNIIKTVTAKIFTQPDGSSYIRIMGADGNKILLENADKVICVSGNDDLGGNGDVHNNEKEIIVHEGNDSSQYQILKCDNSEFVMEYSENGHADKVSYLSRNDNLGGNGDVHNSEEEKILYEGDGSSQFQILKYDNSEFIMEYAENGHADEITCISGNDNLGGNGDVHNSEEEIMLYEGDGSSQFQIVKCDNSEFIMECAENGHGDEVTCISGNDNLDGNGDDHNNEEEIIRYKGDDTSQFQILKFDNPAFIIKYEKHQFVHNPGQEHLCNVCGKGFETKEILERHILVHSVPDSIIDCPVCQSSVRKSALTQHIKNEHSKDKSHCEICSKTFANPSNLKRHMMIHAGIREFQCEICFKRFHQKVTLQTHRITHMTSYFCSFCDNTFGRREELTEHRESGNCSKSKLKEVLKSVKNIITSSEGKLLGYACLLCKVMFSDESELEQHVESTHIYDPAEFQCLECSMVLTSKQELQSHISVHNTVKNRNAKPFLCPICGKGCASHALLVMHERVHTNERPFTCHLCSLKFKTKTHLRTHQLTHTKEKKFSCEVCRKSFALKGNLVVHFRTHTGERPYICSICGDGFIDSKYLKKHKLKKHT